MAAKSDQANIHAWTPAYDNMDGGEEFWKMYELSRLTEDDIEQLPYEMNLRDTTNGKWYYIWAVSIYYSVLVIGGNEMQPA